MMRHLIRLRLIKTKAFVTFVVIFICIAFFSELMKSRRSILYGNIELSVLFSSSNYLPGSFINRNTVPSNESYCYFRYGLPDVFQWRASDLKDSPQLGSTSPYRVLYNVINSSVVEPSALTYCTHATPEFLLHVTEIARFWEGPISVTIFVPDIDADQTIKLLHQLCHCLPEMIKVSVHFIFPVRSPPVYRRDLDSHSAYDCLVPDVNKLKTFRGSERMVYPVNVARNVARTAANTKYVLVSDVELIPSEYLASRFIKMIKRLEKSKKGLKLTTDNHVFVVPVFEVDSSVDIPRKKNILQLLYEAGKAVYFHRWICLHCQRFPGLQKWLNNEADNSISPLLVVRREFPYHRWEPVYIGTRNEPYYSETLSWEGQQDKMTQMLEMCLLDYRFVILDGAFLVHTPGIKRRPAKSKNVWRRPHERYNTQQYAAVLKELAGKYVENPRCRLM